MTMSASSQPPARLQAQPDNARVASTRLVDALVAGTGLIVFAPLMAMIAAAVFFEGGRPIIFSQVRLGRGGRPFKLYKFRKFDAVPGRGGALTVKDDPRLTRVGKFLLWTKFDELPQLWNILNDDMAVVGPRPESLDFADCFEDGYHWLLDHKPGIFGPTQVFFRNETALHPNQANGDPERFYRDVLFPLKARIDRAYYPARTPLRDLAWIVRGIGAVFGWAPSPRDGADLVAEVEEWMRRNSLCEALPEHTKPATGIFAAPLPVKR
jgi:lipopolysaccharide/colanic/teichoic acid biosynthesis glycosyltransferase